MIKNKLIGLSLVLIVCLIAFRFVFFISYVRSQKTEFRRTVIANGLHHLKRIEFPAAELYKNKNGFEWKENNRELVIDGKYFEVISVINTDNLSVVLVIEDSEENELFKKYLTLNKTIQGKYKHLTILFLDFSFIGTYDSIHFPSIEQNLNQQCANRYLLAQGKYREMIKPPACT
jgi:hypothetical protein